MGADAPPSIKFFPYFRESPKKPKFKQLTKGPSDQTIGKHNNKTISYSNCEEPQ